MRRKEKGTALIVAMVVMVMIAGMATALLNLGMVRSRSADFRMELSRTFQIAQSAVARARAIIDGQEYTEGDSFDDLLTQVSFGNDFIDDRDASGEPFAAGTVSAGEYFATVTKLSGDLYRIRAGGRRPGREHMEFVAGVEDIVRVTPPSLNPTVTPFSNSGAAKSKGDLTITGGTTDSYNSDDGAYDPSSAGSEGDVGSNTNVIIGGTDGETPTVNGDASAGGTVTVLGGAVVTGTSTDGVAPENMPSVKDMGEDFLASNNNAAIGIAATGGDLGGNNNNSLPTGTYYLDDVTVANNYTLTIQTPCRVYVSGFFDVKSNGDIIIDTSGGGSVEFYLAGGGTIKGATGGPGVPIKPSDFQIYSHGTDLIKFQTPHVDAVACVYAPDAPIELKGNVEICGSFVGNTVTVNSAQTKIHYDTALAGVSVEVDPPPNSPTPTWVISLWDDTDPALVWRQIPVVRSVVEIVE